MVHIPSIYALNHKLPWIAEPCHDIHGLLVYPIRHEIFRQRAVVTVGDFLLWARRRLFLGRSAPIVQIFHIYEVDVTVFIAVTLVA